MKPVIELVCVLICATLISCNDNFNEPFTPQTYDVQGKVEKGPFISGSEISIQPMNSKLQVLGSMFNTSITDDLGNFVLGNRSFSMPYAELMANGYFFNEVKGSLSNGTLTLRALVDLSDNTTVNINVLTHLKYARIKSLVASGRQFNDANSQAQQELLTAFGLSSYSDNDVSSFSIIAGTEESAALIAISSLLLMDRTEAALTEYLSKLSAYFGEHGCFSEEQQTQLASDKKRLAKYLSDIKGNIIERYNNLGITIEVKDLSYYVDWDNDGVAGNELLKENEKIEIEKSVIEVPNEGGNFTIQIESPIPLYLEPQVETTDTGSEILPEVVISVALYEGYDSSYFTDKDISCENRLDNKTLSISVSSLHSKIDKSKTISLYDYIGNVVGSIELVQKGRIIDIPASEAPLLGEFAKEIVNGIIIEMSNGFSYYNLIEQFYNYNKLANTVNNYIYPSSDKIYSSWSGLYTARTIILQLKKADEELLNVYGDYCNVLIAMIYSNLVYGWGDVPYITDYDQLEQIANQGGIPRESTHNILKDLRNKLFDAIEALPEKKNLPLKDVNGLFFASKDVARVLLANIYMYEGNYNEAKPLLEKVIDNGFYSLDAYTAFKPSTTINEPDISKSTEVIFALLCEIGSRAGIKIMQAEAIPYITLSDVYLSLAECNYKLNNISVAEQYIQSVIDAKKLEISESNTLMRIQKIREQVLLYSGTYFAFLKRIGIAQDFCGIEDYQLLLPIPIQEIYSNRYITQNPGY